QHVGVSVVVEVTGQMLDPRHGGPGSEVLQVRDIYNLEPAFSVGESNRYGRPWLAPVRSAGEGHIVIAVVVDVASDEVSTRYRGVLVEVLQPRLVLEAELSVPLGEGHRHRGPPRTTGEGNVVPRVTV